MKFDPNKDYYSILGVSQQAGDKQIHDAYKSLARKYHPDKHQGNDLEELARDKLIEVNEAFEVLSKRELRDQYDTARMSRRIPHSPTTGGNTCTSAGSPPNAQSVIRKFAVLIVLLAALPFILRFIRSPRVVAVIGIAILIAWFVPRLKKK